MASRALEQIEIEPAANARVLRDGEIPRMEIPLIPREETVVRKHRLRRPLPPLPLWLRVVVLLVGWIVLLVGVAGLVLPGIQGVLTIVLGAAILSVASELAHKWMRQSLKRWPKIWHRVEAMREKIHGKLHKMVNKD